jgi:hypothetical protein
LETEEMEVLKEFIKKEMKEKRKQILAKTCFAIYIEDEG